MKTGALLRFGVEAGAILADASPDRQAALVRYGEALVAAFQVADDILDAESTDAELGKRTGKDAARNKATFVSVHGLARAKGLRDELVGVPLPCLSTVGFITGSKPAVASDLLNLQSLRSA